MRATDRRIDRGAQVSVDDGIGVLVDHQRLVPKFVGEIDGELDFKMLIDFGQVDEYPAAV